MSITYPLVMPALQGLQKIKIGSSFVVGMATSPFTKQQQAQEWPGSAWMLQGSLPPIKDRANAEDWICSLLALNGMSGSFLQGDPNGLAPRGSAKVNLFTFSEDFENAIWNGAGLVTVVADSVADPNGVIGADVLTSVDGIGSVHYDLVAGAASYTASVYLRAGTATAASLSFFDVTAPGNLAISAKILSGPGTLSNASGIEAIVRGLSATLWTRLAITLAAPMTAGHTLRTSILVNRDGAAHSTLSNAVWGAQLEPGLYAGSYGATGAAALAPSVNGGGQTGKTLATKGWPASINGVLLKGDYIQLGGGVTTRLYKTLSDTNSDGGGLATLDLFPRLRETPGDGDQLSVANCLGTFRLADNNQAGWDLDSALLYGVTFSAIEAL